MFKKKIKIHIYKNEISLVLKALNEFRNEAIGKGRYTDCIDELIRVISKIKK